MMAATPVQQPNSSHETPFTLPPVMDGYPLQKGEKVQLDRLLERYRKERDQASEAEEPATT